MRCFKPATSAWPHPDGTPLVSASVRVGAAAPPSRHDPVDEVWNEPAPRPAQRAAAAVPVNSTLIVDEHPDEWVDVEWREPEGPCPECGCDGGHRWGCKVFVEEAARLIADPRRQDLVNRYRKASGSEPKSACQDCLDAAVVYREASLVPGFSSLDLEGAAEHWFAVADRVYHLQGSSYYRRDRP